MEKTDDLPIWIELLITVSGTAAVYGFIYLPGIVWRLIRPKQSQIQTGPTAIGRVEPQLALLMLGILMMVLFGGLEILSIVVRNGTDNLYTHIGFTLAAGSGIYLITAYRRVWIEYNEIGASYQTTFGFRGRVSWLEVRSVRFSAIMERLTFKNSLGEKMRVPVTMVSGIQKFADTVLENVDQNAFNEKTRTAITQLAAGNSPTAGNLSGERSPLARFVIYSTHQLRKVIAHGRRR